MTIPGVTQPDCEKPHCSSVSAKTYTGPNGNELRLCEACYYSLVTEHSTPSLSAGGDILEQEANDKDGYYDDKNSRGI